MAKHLSDGDVARIIEIIDGWSGKLTWAKLVAVCGDRLGFSPARQTLARFERIQDAFDGAKARLKEMKPARPLPPTLAVAVQRLDRLEAENARLRAENSRLLEQFARWQLNAEYAGVHYELLNRPLRRVDRGNT